MAITSDDIVKLIEKALDDSTILLDLPYFQGSFEDKAAVLQSLLMVFGCPNDNPKVQKISFEKHINSDSLLLKAKEYQFFPQTIKPQLNHIAGVLLYDLVKNAAWWAGVADEDQQKAFLKHVTQFSFEGSSSIYDLKILQSRIVSQVLIYRYPEVWDDQLEVIIDILQTGETSDQLEMSIRTLLYFMQGIEDEKKIKQFHTFVPKVLPGLFSAFTNDQVDAHGREQILDVLYYCLRTVSWADGIDNELVDSCLQDTFNSWMSLFLQIIQTNPRSFFDIKKNALKCLTVIFRDFINYSRECLSMILQPSWKLLIMHVPVYTEIAGYQAQLKDMEAGEQDETKRGYESDDGSDLDSHGVEGMTQNLIELLTTLVQRQNLQEVVRQGIVPLLQTVTSYMILPYNRERYHQGDYNHFIHDRDEDVYKQRNIRNSCLDLISSLIEVFGDDAVQSILFIIESLLQSNPVTQETRQPDEPNPMESYYFSKNKKHPLKRREVALFLLGTFAEDIQMFRVRNPQYNLKLVIQESLVDGPAKYEGSKLQGYLRGRTLWCAIQLVEIMPQREYDDIYNEILKMAAEVIIEETRPALKLVATRALIKYSRKAKPEALQVMVGEIFEAILDELIGMLDTASLDTIHLPIEAFTAYSRLNEAIVGQMAPKITPKLLRFFKNLHNDTSVTLELLNLFKIWCNYDACRDILVNTFVPYIMDIIEMYYKATPNQDNKDQILVPQAKVDADQLPDHQKESKPLVDASILTHVMDLLNILLKKTNRTTPEFGRILDLFPKLLSYVQKSDDMFLLLNGVSTLRTFMNLGQGAEIKKRSNPKEIIDVAKKMLLPTTNENSAICIGNYVIQIFHKIEPKIDTNLLMSVVWKIYKSRMPSIVQSLTLIFSRLIHYHPKEIIDFLSETSIDNRISLKIVLDKWLLQQPLFRGHYTRNTTLSALLKLLLLRDPRIESLMVIGYNPSHSNVNSEVNAPFKMLSLMLRYIENEMQPNAKGAKLPKRLREKAAVDGEEEKEEPVGTGLMAGYKMKREAHIGDGERLDTIDVNDDDDDYEPNEVDNFSNDDQGGDDEDVDSEDERRRRTGAERIEVNLDDIKDDEDEDPLLEKGGLLGKPPAGLFTIKESQDRGLADMETGSEVYMSELLAGFDMEDFDEAEEQNEEDLLELGDSFGNINLKDHVINTLNEFIAKNKAGSDYIAYCVKQLLQDDQELAKKHLKLAQGGK